MSAIRGGQSGFERISRLSNSIRTTLGDGKGSIPSFQRDEYLRLSFSRDLSIEETKEGMDSVVREFRLATPIPDWKDGNAHFSL